MPTQTSKIELFIPVKPVPASRPRVSRWGTYFSKNYEDFRNQCSLFLSKIKKQYPPQAGKFKVQILFICHKPANPANSYPRGDVDNFLKGPLDAITKAGMIWEDDIQITRLIGIKRYAKAGEQVGMKITITKL
jgi:Holliday junction resolvase RusA-like endonuclease